MPRVWWARRTDTAARRGTRCRMGCAVAALGLRHDCQEFHLPTEHLGIAQSNLLSQLELPPALHLPAEAPRDALPHCEHPHCADLLTWYRTGRRLAFSPRARGRSEAVAARPARRAARAAPRGTPAPAFSPDGRSLARSAPRRAEPSRAEPSRAEPSRAERCALWRACTRARTHGPARNSLAHTCCVRARSPALAIIGSASLLSRRGTLLYVTRRPRPKNQGTASMPSIRTFLTAYIRMRVHRSSASSPRRTCRFWRARAAFSRFESSAGAGARAAHLARAARTAALGLKAGL